MGHRGRESKGMERRKREGRGGGSVTLQIGQVTLRATARASSWDPLAFWFLSAFFLCASIFCFPLVIYPTFCSPFSHDGPLLPRKSGN